MAALEAQVELLGALGDPTRLRLLHLLGPRELTVGELTQATGLGQSRVSTHLGRLREQGLVRDRRDGTYVFYRFTPPTEGPWQEGWALVEQGLNFPEESAGRLIQREVIALQQSLRSTLGLDEAKAVSFDAGLRTGDYLLANRIPKGAQRILKLLPPGPASGILLKAVAKHAWTFSGSGQFGFETGRPVRVTITGCPICRGAVADTAVCHFYTGCFQRLFRVLVSARTEVAEVQCQATGADACVFEMRW